MHIKSSNSAVYSPTIISKLENLIRQVEALEFQAIVVNKAQPKIYLIKSEGKIIRIDSDLDLKLGDVLSLKKNISDGLLITQISRQQSVLSNASKTIQKIPDLIKLPSLNKNIENLSNHFIAKVINKNSNIITFKNFQNQTFTIPVQQLVNSEPFIKLDSYFSIKKYAPELIEIISLNSKQLLKQAIIQQLPKLSSSNNHWHQFTQSVNKLVSTELNSVSIKPVITNLINSQIIAATPSATKEHFAKVLQSLNSLMPNLSHTFTTYLQQPISTKLIDTLFKALGLIGTSSANTTNPQTNLMTNLSALKQTIEYSLRELEPVASTPKGKPKPEDEATRLIKNILNEIKPSVDKLLNKLMVQNISSKITQESNQNIFITTQIPIQIDKEIVDVKVKVQQQKDSNSEHDDEDTWEIHLDFEMGILGLIYTRIKLKELSHVAIQFWADKNETLQKIEASKHIFEQQILRSGLNLDALSVFLGAPKQESELDLKPNTQLIDINV